LAKLDSMNNIIQSNLQNLNKSKYILTNLSDTDLCDTSISPYYSSIGSHIRHILDFYDCVLNLDEENRIDLTARSRNKDVESCCDNALQYLNSIVERLENVDFENSKNVAVIDDLGLGKTEIPYTIGAVFAQANSHTIHHFAIINYIFDRLGITLNDSDFGYNPTTPKETSLN